MKQKNRFVFDMLDQDAAESENEVLYRAGKPVSLREEKGTGIYSIPYNKYVLKNQFLYTSPDSNAKIIDAVVRCYGESIVRIIVSCNGHIPSDDVNPMFSWDPSIPERPLHVIKNESEWKLCDENNNIKMSVQPQEVQPEIWSTLQPEPYDAFNASVFPSPAAEVSFAAHDDFFPSQSESFSLGFVERDQKADRCVFFS